MKVSLASVLASSFVVSSGSCNVGISIVSAFTTPTTLTSTSSTHHVNNKQRRQFTNLYMSKKKKKVLTAADVISKSKSTNQSSGDPAAPNKGTEQPKIFLPQIYTTFQSTLLLLEKRISNGSNSLSKEEVTQFENEINDLIEEMNDYNLDPKGEGEKIKSYYESLENDVDGSDVSVVDVTSKKDDGKLLLFCMFLCVLLTLYAVGACRFCNLSSSY